MNTIELTDSQCQQIATILRRRANEIAGFNGEHKDLPASVGYACTIEINRLRDLARAVHPSEEGVDLHS
jgi:hypothetical protein